MRCPTTSLPRPSPPDSSGMHTPNVPSSAIARTVSSGISALARCHLCACGRISTSVKRRNWSRMVSRSEAPRLSEGHCPAARADAISARAPAWSASRRAAQVAASLRASVLSPRSEGRRISFCPIGKPPTSCPSVSAKASLAMRESSAEPLRAAQIATASSAATLVAIHAKPCAARW